MHHSASGTRYVIQISSKFLKLVLDASCDYLAVWRPKFSSNRSSSMQDSPGSRTGSPQWQMACSKMPASPFRWWDMSKCLHIPKWQQKKCCWGRSLTYQEHNFTSILRKAIKYLKANHGKTEALNFAGIGLKHLHEETQFWGIKRPGGVLNRTGFMRA